MKQSGITQEEYERAQRVWETFDLKTMGDYHDLYVTTDTLLLAGVFENFRRVCKQNYGLDPANYYTAPGLSWDALLKHTRIELELLTNVDKHLFFERAKRGGISSVGHRGTLKPIINIYPITIRNSRRRTLCISMPTIYTAGP